MRDELQGRAYLERTRPKLAGSSAILLLIGMNGAAVAQNADTSMIPPVQRVVENNVNLMDGSVFYNTTDLEVGEPGSSSELKMSRSYDSNRGQGGQAIGSFGRSWEHSYKIYLIDVVSPSSPGVLAFGDVDVVIGAERHSFTLLQKTGGYGSAYRNLLGDGSTLSKNGAGTVYTFQSSSGDVVTFQTSLSCGFYPCAFADKILKSDGSLLYLYYDVAGTLTQGAFPISRLRRVANSFGYGLNYSYVDGGTSGTLNTSRLVVSEVDGVTTACPTSAVPCSDNVLAKTFYRYDQGRNNIISSTDPSGNVTSYVYDSINTQNLRSIIPPNGAGAPLFTIDWGSAPWGYGIGPLLVVSGRTDESGNRTSYSFTYSMANPYSSNVSVNSPNGVVAYYYSNHMGLDDGDRSLSQWMLSKFVDGKGNSVTQEYDGSLRPTKITYPEGNFVLISYDDRGNVVSRTVGPKSGSTQAGLVSTASYSASCDGTNFRICNKQSFFVDPKGNRTDFVWNAANGKISSQSDGFNAADVCVVAGGICPATTYAYKTVTGADGASISLLGSKTVMIGAGASVTTSYDYDAVHQFALKEVVDDVGGLNLRTCYGHDFIGNVTSRILPRAGLASCP